MPRGVYPRPSGNNGTPKQTPRQKRIPALDADEVLPADILRCDICWDDSRHAKILEFELVQEIRSPANGAKISRKCGKARYCATCWSKGPAKRRDPRGRPRKWK